MKANGPIMNESYGESLTRRRLAGGNGETQSKMAGWHRKMK
jgi:hypothetical protein